MGPQGGREGGQGRRSGWEGLVPRPRRTETGRREHGWGWGRGPAGMGSPVALPQPGPGLPLTQPHGDRGLSPDSQCGRRLRLRRQGRGWEAGALRQRLRLRPAARGGGSWQEEAAAVLRLKSTETAGDESTAQARCGRAVRTSGAEPGHPPSPGNRAARGGQPLPLPRPSNGGGRCGRGEQSL